MGGNWQKQEGVRRRKLRCIEHIGGLFAGGVDQAGQGVLGMREELYWRVGPAAAGAYRRFPGK